MVRGAFTLIELLVVVAIIAVLAGMLLPAIGLVREAARASKCRANLRNITVGIASYGQDWEGYLPPSFIDKAVVPPDYVGYASHYNHAGIAAWSDEPLVGAYIDGPDIWNGSVLGTTDPAAARGSVLRCPSDRTVAVTGGGAVLPNTSYGLTAKVCKFVTVAVPTSSTDWQAWTGLVHASMLKRPADLVIAAETKDPRWYPRYTSPATAYRTDPELIISWATWVQAPDNWFMRHRGGCNLLFADGHVRHSQDPEVEVATRQIFACMEDMP